MSSLRSFLLLLENLSDPDGHKLSVKQLILTLVIEWLSWRGHINVDIVHLIILSQDTEIVHSSLFSVLEVSPDIAEVRVALNVAIGMHKKLSSQLSVKHLILSQSTVSQIILLHEVQSLSPELGRPVFWLLLRLVNIVGHGLIGLFKSNYSNH